MIVGMITYDMVIGFLFCLCCLFVGLILYQLCEAMTPPKVDPDRKVRQARRTMDGVFDNARRQFDDAAGITYDLPSNWREASQDVPHFDP